MIESDLPSIIALICLLLLSAFFSGSETALIGSKRVRLGLEADEGRKWAKIALKLLKDPGSLLGTILVGNNLVNVAAAVIVATLLGPVKATILVTLLLLLVGEIPPKTMAAMWPEKVTRLVVYPIAGARFVFFPVVWITTFLANLLLWPVTRNLRPRRMFYSEAEIQSALDESQEAGELEPGEARMAQESLELDEIQLKDIMIPFEKIAGLELDLTIEQVREVVKRARFSRYPVYYPGARRVRGMLHIKDLVIHSDEERWQTVIRKLHERPMDMDADDLLREMQIARFHMAAIVDGKRRIIGLVTMERILEEIVGEIADEHDREVDPIREVDRGIYRVRKDLEVADVARILNVDIPADEPEQTIDEFYRNQTENKPTSGLRFGSLLIRYGKKGYLITLFDQLENGEDQSGVEE